MAAAGRDFIAKLDRVNEHVGNAIAWLALLMVLNTILVVLLRDAFDFGRIWMQELTTWMHAVLFMLAMGYTLRHEEHVRVDIFYRGASAKTKAIVDIAGCLLLLLPVCALIGYESFSYVFGANGSWQSMESSRQAGGLPFPAPAILKTCILLMPLLLSLQSIVLIARALDNYREANAS